jgi:hypothetical protein
MALNRKDLETLTRDIYSRATSILFDDFVRTEVKELESYYGLKKSTPEQRNKFYAETFNTCDSPGCNGDRALNYRFCESCLEDRRFEDRWGKIKKLKTRPLSNLAEVTIQMMDKEHGDGWTRAMEIIYGGEGR